MNKDETVKARRTAVKTVLSVMRKLKLRPVKMELECSVSSTYNHQKSVHAVLAVYAENSEQSSLQDFCNIGFKHDEVTRFTIRVTVTENHLELVVLRSDGSVITTGVVDNCYTPGLYRIINALPLANPLHVERSVKTSYIC